MSWRWDASARIAQRKVVAIVRAQEAAVAETVGDVVIEAGLDVLEVPLTTPDALGAIERLSRRHPGALIGAGTVLDAASARLAILAGARFLVSPSLHADVLATGHRYGAAVLPGVQTPTEVVQALEAGADLIKLFPADEHTPGYVKAIRAALPQAPIVPTGGVDASNARAWLDAGAVALGVGGTLTRDPAQAGARAAELLAAVG
ncbi:bifunctional 4-hydroxy-2-oxoglutarate aldolase/2-dehydro-3-deoxy-phosphogluconate aldolase [Conexibacter stalactiti]|uniref:Bifunctional 4-hydroxy-2-oxoglutarate aldolase/2-dehydro-3-deoxy-phosphogluconate aldolase n=1 Tax=Conexibacter stalactiti TaxID=1940611 RepID=A0ABU4HTM3_9ACTN|nr:bifunctional 4-hydroxy-2-oxoglutarate aldolase/2-dehydro-3-deoxy-phosphogluconate aldolase [Conexibacter stalactiti]MDW5596610.1 bifunctional 4-hydroxy-2-oxoglutarate aldolase/2-dehydro-3-deoxy-phosphogluconate aldolase [Conexibacter stalactiti]MEC5037252.1 bifunctional 4-hydroxy-2-oxoglutarate aldolase/2-dehydro-3-deoxy-phosphogluconate aldolase [Conexibacter stalactiti]